MKFSIELPQAQQFGNEAESYQPINNLSSQSKFSIELPQEESYPSSTSRHLARSASRILETFGGMPKAATKFAESMYNMMPESLREMGLVQKALPGGNVVGPAWSKAYEIGSSLLPSSENIRTGMSQITQPGYLDPRNEYEELADDIVSDFASLVVPIGPLGKTKPLKALGIAIPSNVASYLTKSLGGGESAQTGVKFGTALLTSLGMGPSLRKQAEEFYATAKNAIKPGEKIAAHNVHNMLNRVTREYTSTGLRETAGKNEVENVIDEIRSYIHNGKMELNDLWQVKKDMKDAIRRIIPGTQAEVELSKISHSLNDALKNSGNKVFSNALLNADEIYSGVKRAEKINNFIKNTLTSKVTKTGSVISLLTNPIGTLTTLAKAAPFAIPGATFGFGGAHLGNALWGTLKSPAIRNAYTGMLSAGLKENAPLVIRNAEKLNALLEEKKPKK